jgi:hypothetical protein
VIHARPGFIDTLCRSLGGTVGISIGQAIYTSVGYLNFGHVSELDLVRFQVLSKKAKNISNLSLDTSAGALSESVRKLQMISVSGL